MKDYVIALSGEAGQGLNTIGDMLALSLFRNGYCIFTDKSYHSRIRAESTSTEFGSRSLLFTQCGRSSI